jgi:hypothetical protein
LAKERTGLADFNARKKLFNSCVNSHEHQRN